MAGLFGAPRRLPKIDPGLGAMMQREQGILPGDMPQVGQMPQMPGGQQKRPGLGTRLLGEGWEAKVAALGGLVRGDPNAVTDYQALQQHRQDQAERLRQASLGREQEWQDWVKREEWKRANPTPANNDTISDYNFIVQNLGPEAGEAYLRRQADPDVTVPLPNGQMYIGPRSGMAAVLGGQARPRNLGPVVDTIPGGPGGSPSGAGFRP